MIYRDHKRYVQRKMIVKYKVNLFVTLALGLLMSVSWLGVVLSQAVSEGFSSDTQIQRGMLVALKNDGDRKIELLTAQNLDRFRGVVINKNDSPVTLSTDKEQVFVANSGTQEVIVSAEGGEIKKGDYISISSVAGIGTKAGAEQPTVVGRASANFDKESGALGSIDANNTKLQVTRIPVDIAPGKNPLQKQQNSNVPEFLAKASRGIAKKDVSLPRIYLAFTLLMVTSLICGVLLYGGVKGGLVSIGRNPLSKDLIVKNLVQVVLTSFIIFIIGLFAVYLILRL